MIKSADIEKKIPLLAYEDGFLVSKLGDVTLLYELTLPDVFSCGESDYDNLNSVWIRALRALPDDCIVHKQDVFVTRRFTPGAVRNPQEKKSFLSLASDRHFEGRAYLDHRCYLYLTKCPSRANTRTSISSSILSTSQQQRKARPAADAERDFRTAAVSSMAILQEAGIPFRELSADEVIGDKDRFGIIEQYISLDYRKKSVLPDIAVADGGLRVGSKRVSMFAIADLDQLPPEVSTGVAHSKFSSDRLVFAVGYPLQIGLGLGFNHIYNQYFFIEDQKKVLKDVEQASKHQKSFSRISRENAVNMEFNEEYIEQATRENERCVRCSFNLIIWDASESSLQRKNTIASARLAAMDITARELVGVVPHLFWAGIPGAASYYPKEETFMTFLDRAACFINDETNYHTSKSGFGIRLCDRIAGVPLNVDISDEPRERGWIDNRNKFILGPSGSGKSFFTNHMVRQYYEQGTHVVIVDVGDSYQGLCRLINEETGGADGLYYTYTEEKPISFNPFYVADNSYTIEKREQLASLIFCLWKNESESITKAEETHIATAINNYVEKIISGESAASFNAFYDYLRSDYRRELSERNVRRENFDIENLLQVLRPYYEGGMYDFLLNAKENMDLLSNRFIVFEIDNIKDHKTLFPVVTLILMDTFLSKMRHPSLASQRKMILIEEAWKAISKSGTAEFIKYLYKTVRKHFGEAVVVTQEVDDIIGNPIVKEAIISNADCKILLDQRKYQNKFEVVQQVLSLSDKERAIALSVNRDVRRTDGRNPYKEVFISLNGNHTAVYAVEVSREEYLTYTTEKKEKARLMSYAGGDGGMRGAIERYITEERRQNA